MPIDLASEHEVIKFLLNETLARAVRENKVLEVTDCLNKEINGTKADVDYRDQNNRTLLHYAAQHGYFNIVEPLVKYGADVNATDIDKWTPLHYAAKEDHIRIVQFLVQKGANINAQDFQGKLPIDLASEHEVIKFLLNEALAHAVRQNKVLEVTDCLNKEINGAKADANHSDQNNRTLLHYAAQHGYFNIVESLVKYGADVNATDIDKWTPLHYTAKEGHIRIVQFLVQKGANINAQDSQGKLPIDLASEHEVIKFLLNEALAYAVRQNKVLEVTDCLNKEINGAKADADYRDQNNGTLLHHAAQHGYFNIVESLVKYGADVNAIDIDKWTPLHYTAKEGHIRIVQFLVQKGANINAQDSQGKLPIDLASEHEVIKFLLNETLARAVRENKVLEVTDCLNKEINGTKADVDYRDQNNGTLLHHAAQHGYFNIVEPLVKYGANVNATDIDKWTPLHCASKDGSLNVVMFLADSQADINAKNSDRDKPLHIAVKNGHYSVVRFFIRDKKMSVDDKGKDDWTPLQYAVAGNYSQIASFLLEKGSASWNGYSGNVTALLAGLALAGGISAENNKGKVPLWLTKGQNVVKLFRKPRLFSQELFAKINVPADGSCLFWAAILAYLIPVRYSDNAFKEKFNRLFGSLSPAELEQVQSLIKEYNPYSNSMAIRNSETLRKLVTEKFRNRVIDEMLRDRSRFEESITVHDFLHSRNTGYIIDGKFQEKFHSEFSAEIGEHNIDIDKLKPSTLNEDTVKEIDSELDKIPDQNKVKQFKFATYVECMRDSKAWGGNHEIQAMSRMLHSNILVFSDGAKHSVGCDSCNDQIQLFNDGESHYNFGLVKVQALIEAIKNNKQQEAKTYLSIGIDDINYQDSEDWTALHFAAQHDNTEVLQLLLEQGASVNIENSVGQTAIDVARLFEKNDVVDILSRQSQAVPSQVEQPLTFNKRQEISGIEGQFYEIRLPMLFLLQGLVKKGDEKINNFYLATNMEEAGGFDDIVFKYEYKDSSGVAKSRVIFLQAKHREDPGEKGEKVTVEKLLSEAESEDFSLKKYFISYRKIKQQFSETANDPVLKSKFEDCDFIIYTNAPSTFSSAGNIIKEGSIEENDFLKISDSQNKYYQLEFNSDKKEEIVNVLKNSSDCRRLAKELATSIFSGRIIDMQKDIFKSYHLSLVEKVIEKTEPKEGKLKRDFLDDDESLSVGDKEFKRIFLEEAEKVFKKQGNALKRELKNKTVRLSDKFGVNNENVSPPPLPNDLVSEGEINEFLSKLKLFVDQPDKRKLGAIIKSKIQEVYKVEQRDIDSVFSDVKYQIISRRWWQNGNNYLTENNRFFQDAARVSIKFDVREPVPLFTGRGEKLNELHRTLQNGGQLVISQMASVTGLGGIGKSELARKYISEHSQDYDGNVIWINADNYLAITESFRRLAKDRLGISTVDENGKEKDIESIVPEVYDFFAKKHRKGLFIFDNAGKYKSIKEGDEIGKFLPSGSNKLSVLITSRDQKWGRNIAQLQLGVFTKEEAVEFIRKALGIEVGSKRREIKELAETLQYFPLALQQAVAYIEKENKEASKWQEGSSAIRGYLEKLQEKGDELSGKISDEIHDRYTRAVVTTWEITIDKIKQKAYGEQALEILNIIAYLAPDKIPMEELFSKLIGNKKVRHNAVELLDQYSMAGLESGKLNTHRLVQQVTRIKLKDKNKEKEAIGNVYRLLDQSFPYLSDRLEDYPKKQQLLPHFEAFLSNIDNWLEKNSGKRKAIEKDYMKDMLLWMVDGYSDLGNLRRKNELRERALAIQDKHYGPEHSQAAIMFNSLAGDRQEEKELLEGALPMKKISDSSIQHYGMQQKSYSRLFQFISHNIPNTKVQSVKQGLYLPSFEAREIKINGKCAAITRTFSQMLFFDSVFLAGQFLQNMEISAELYERLAQGKQISAREEREIFDFSRVLDKFEQQLDSPTSSLPSSLSHIKSYKQSDDLLRYVSDLTGDFAIHLVTSNHVVAIYRVGDIYAYFDSNVAFVSNLKSIFQLIRVLEKAVAFAGYEIAEDGFLVEHFDVTKANDALTAKQKQTLMKPIQTERHLLSVQDQKLGPINLNGQELFRTALYDLGTKLHLEGSSPILINSDMNLSNENLLAYLNTGKISITAREYLESLRNSVVDTALVQTTKTIPFAGSRNEVKHAQQIQELLSSGSKLKSYELNDLLKSPIEKSIKALPYYLEVANSKHWPNRLTNAAGRIQLIRGVHGAAVSCDRERGNTKDCLLNTGEISLSLVSQLIEDKIVQNVPKLIKSLKTVKFGTHILRGGAAIISSPFDVYDIIDSAIDLHNCEKGSSECKDAIAGVTFASTSLASGVVLTAIGAPGVGTAAGLIIMIAQGAYGGGRAIEEFQPYRLTFDENFRLFWHAFALQPVPTDIEYIKARKDIVNQIAKQVWEQLQNRSESVVAHATGLGDITFKEELECTPIIREGLDRYQSCTHKRVRAPILFQSNATMLMDLSSIKGNDYRHFLSRILPDSPSQDAVMLCLPAFSGKDYERDYTLNNGYSKYESSPTVTSYCDNAMMIGDKQRMNQVINKKVVFDLNLVNQGVVVGSDKWQNDFIVFKGKTKILGGENTRNTFILTSDSFAGTIFGGKNSTNTLDISNLGSSHYSLYIDDMNNLLSFDRTGYTTKTTGYTTKTNKKQIKEQANEQVHFYGISNVVISANTTVEGNGDKYTFYIKPAPGYSKINVAKGSIIFPETALLLDCDSFTYSKESNALSMKFSNFTLDIANYFNREGKSCNFELLDKYGSMIEPLVDLAQNNSQEVKLFNLRTETALTYDNVTKWYEDIAKTNKRYKVYGTVKVKYPITQERHGFYPHMTFGTQESDIVPVTKETWYAEGREGSDSYNVISSDNTGLTTEINNYAEDGMFDLLYMPVNSIQVSKGNNNLHLYAADSTHSVKVKDYFVNNSYQHLTVIDENKDVFVPLIKESTLNNQQDVQLVPFYHTTKDQYMFSLSAEKVANNSEIIVDARLDDIKFYRDGSNLMLIDDKPIIVKLENFYNKHKSWQNLTLNFWHSHHKNKLDSKQLFELAKLAIDYQDEIKNTYYDSVKEYIVPVSNSTISNATIHHNQELTNGTLTTVEPSTKRIGVLVLQDDISPSNLEVSVDNEDLVFFVAQNNATFTIKNWNDTDHRVSTLRFNQEEKPIEVRGLDKFDLSQVSEIQSLIGKAVLSSIASQQLERLDSNVVNGIKYLLAVRGIENGTSTYKCLGFDSAGGEQQFISTCHSHYNSEKLSQVLSHEQGVKALVWLVVKGYTDLSLENHGIDKRSLLNNLDKCFNSVANKRIINRIVKKLEVEDIETVVPNVESFIRHHREALEDRIVNSLRSNTTEIDTEEGTHQRKRRDESEVKGYENSNDQAFFNTQNHAAFTIKDKQVTSGASKLSSWVNSVVSTISNGVSKLFSLAKISSLPAINVEYHNNFQNNNATTPNIDVDGTILLLDVLIRKITGQKYIPSANQNISLLEAQASALNTTEEFSKVISSELNVPAGELANLPEMQSKIFKAVISDNGSKVVDILHSYAMSAIGEEKAGDVLAALQTTAKASGKSKEKSNYHNCHFYEVKPRSCLSNIAIEPGINCGLERGRKGWEIG